MKLLDVSTNPYSNLMHSSALSKYTSAVVIKTNISFEFTIGPTAENQHDLLCGNFDSKNEPLIDLQTRGSTKTLLVLDQHIHP
jgi:hypothetical protein